MNNLAGNPEHKTVMAELRAELERWMAHCGDEGQETEMKALERMEKKVNQKTSKKNK